MQVLVLAKLPGPQMQAEAATPQTQILRLQEMAVPRNPRAVHHHCFRKQARAPLNQKQVQMRPSRKPESQLGWLAEMLQK
mmetsp:Transcript_10099/g.28618  ORF Transcript_10099/g.28618 Transcript_10099/m.28618 type:complete len:80 (+) Transcript_10099:1343-1582(+)